VEGRRGGGSQQFSDVRVCGCGYKMSHQPPQRPTLHVNRVCDPGLAGGGHCPAETPGVSRGQVHQRTVRSARTSAMSASSKANEGQNHWRGSPSGRDRDPLISRGLLEPVQNRPLDIQGPVIVKKTKKTPAFGGVFSLKQGGFAWELFRGCSRGLRATWWPHWRSKRKSCWGGAALSKR
jgi:hypothetical protein